MASSLKNLSDYDPNQIPEGSDLSIGIVVSDWNHEITHSLLRACVETLEKHKVAANRIKIIHVPGSYELTKGAVWMVEKNWEEENEEDQSTGMAFLLDAVIILGCVITGETKHDDYINQAVSQSLMQLNMVYPIPFIFGLLTPRTMEQALDRAGGKHGNKGVEAAVTAIKMAKLSQEMNQ